MWEIRFFIVFQSYFSSVYLCWYRTLPSYLSYPIASAADAVDKATKCWPSGWRSGSRSCRQKCKYGTHNSGNKYGELRLLFNYEKCSTRNATKRKQDTNETWHELSPVFPRSWSRLVSWVGLGFSNNKAASEANEWQNQKPAYAVGNTWVNTRGTCRVRVAGAAGWQEGAKNRRQACG